MFYKIVLLIILTIIYNNVQALENKIIFKINEIAYTSYDYKKRVEYLDFIGDNDQLDEITITNDLISAYLFFEFYKKTKLPQDFKKEIIRIFENIKKTNNKNNKKYKYKLDEENLLNNIKLDLIRKNILENLLNERVNDIKISKKDIDLLYKFKIKYINFENDQNISIKNKVNNLETKDLNEVLLLLKKNKIEYFIKEKEINYIDKIDKRIRDKIYSDEEFIYIEKNKKNSLVFIQKEFETFEGIVLDLYSVRSNKEIDKDSLLCSKVVNKKNNLEIVNKEYNLKDLNKELKENLLSINDFVKFKNNDDYIYIVLCNIKFNKDILNNINLNKTINLNVSDIENNFVKKYSQIYNLIKINA